jgi:branched-chain amino acid transport system ATP-binding protein
MMSETTPKSSRPIWENRLLLKLDKLTICYGKAVALHAISMEVPEGGVVSLIGANGAGKTTILRSISGLIPVTSGEIWFKNQRINGINPSEIVRTGLVHIPQGRRLFPFLTVMSNLTLGASLRHDKAGIKRDLEMVFEHFPRLFERRSQKAGTLSGGEQQMLAIGRGLMANPTLILMDEPSLGLAPRMVAELVPVIKSINQRGISVLLVEQNVGLALGVATRAYALQVGRIVLEGDIDKFKTSEVVRAAYLGK